MKSIYRFIALLLCSLSSLLSLSAAKSIKDKIIIHTSDSVTIVYNLEEKPIITFKKSNVIILTSSAEICYPMEDISHFAYEISDITNIHCNEIPDELAIDGDYLSITSQRINSALSIYDIQGKLVLKRLLDVGTCVIPVKQLETGMYVVRIGNNSYKISVK